MNTENFIMLNVNSSNVNEVINQYWTNKDFLEDAKKTLEAYENSAKEFFEKNSVSEIVTANGILSFTEENYDYFDRSSLKEDDENLYNEYLTTTVGKVFTRKFRAKRVLPQVPEMTEASASEFYKFIKDGRANVKELDAKVNELVSAITKYMTENNVDEIQAPVGTVNYKDRNNTTFMMESFVNDHKDLVEQYTVRKARKVLRTLVPHSTTTTAAECLDELALM